MSDPDKILDITLEKAETEIKAGIASGNGVPFWEAAGKALEVVKTNRAAVKDWGVLQFKTLLGTLSRTQATEQSLIRMMTSKQLVMDMEEGATTLKKDTALREATKEKIVDVLLQLGSIGAQLLVRLF